MIIIFPSHFLLADNTEERKLKMQHNWFNALKTLYILFFIFLINTKCGALDDEVSNEVSENFQIQEPEEGTLAKRAWNQLQGSWGKRNANGPRFYPYDDYLDNLKNLDYEVSKVRDYNLISDSDGFDESQAINKRAWKSMNGAWGKRDWNKLRGTGSKREPGNWNNLRGLWGKRSNDPRSWNKLSSAWGK